MSIGSNESIESSESNRNTMELDGIRNYVSSLPVARLPNGVEFRLDDVELNIPEHSWANKVPQKTTL